MSITCDQVRPGVKVRVLRNGCGALRPNENPLSFVLLEPGDVIVLDGSEEGCDDDEASYRVREGLVNYLPLSHLELIEPEPDSATETAPFDVDSGPCGEPDPRLAARIDALAASVAMLRVEIAAELAKLRIDVDAVRREMDYGKDDGK